MIPYLRVTDSATYRIRLAGRVDADWSDFMTGIEISVTQASGTSLTVITGVVPDQAALFGMLCQIRDLGLVLVSVEYLVESN